ncbi:GH25 family lysozyme [Terrisporobacter sp.]|uniref:GH25 family lysozyme n=1 Tax=Terrisporobacter sp. TaxID=1965305 RepID=UPI002603768C|nr:GH25 family lysozyme [Terrisporobacter sp.]
MNLRIKSFFALLLCLIIASQGIVTFTYAEDNTILVEGEGSEGLDVDVQSSIEEQSNTAEESNLGEQHSIEENTEGLDVDKQSSTEEKQNKEESNIEGEPDPGENKGYSMGGSPSGKIPNYNMNARVAMNDDLIGMGTVKASTLDVRQKPSTSSNKLGSLKNGETIEIISRAKDWYKINYNGKLGYVSSADINLIPFEKGIDVSKWNGKIDWNKVKADGIDYVIIRAGYGISDVDPMFYENMKGATNAGLKVGVYWFSYAYSPERAKLEAQKCLDVISPYKNNISYPVFFDYEYDSVDYVKEKYEITVTKELGSQIANSFMSTIEYNGYETGLYTNYDFSSRYFSDEVLCDNNLWIAQYRSECTFEKPYIIWQYTENGKVNGINSDVDLNYSTLKFNKYNGEGTGWVKKNNNTYFVKDNGHKAVDWNQIGGKWYYFNKSGVMQTGWLRLNNIWYYLKINGEMSIGWEKIDGKWFYFNEGGVMYTGWLRLNNIWYYLKTNGEMSTGWEKIDGKWFYFSEGGVMYTGWLRLNNIWYYMKANGEMATNTTIDGWKIDSNGVATPIK